MAEAASIRRAPRRSRPVDLDTFARDVDAALAAFRSDVSYAVLMARSAVTIINKRRVWQTRKDLREAEQKAHAQCRQVPAFECHAAGPCGVADCKFAEGDLAQLDIPDAPGDTRRPQRSSCGDYNIDAAVSPLLDLRGRSL